MLTKSVESNFKFFPTGAIIQEFIVAGHNIVQSFPNEELYRDAPFFSETIGRTTNRIKNGRIDSLNGRSYQIATNDGDHHLHGGEHGWGKKVFSGPTPEHRHGREAVKFVYVSRDGEEGFPGTVELRVWYTAWEESQNDHRATCLEVEYEVEMTGNECEETAVGVTNHSYFNLSGSPSVDGTEITLYTDQYLLRDEGGIPLGPIEVYPGVQVGQPLKLGTTGPDFDDCFVIDSAASRVPLDTRKEPVRKIVAMCHPSTKLHLEISTTEPAFQFYTGQYVDIPERKGSPAKPARCGICVEPSRYVNAINVREWSNMVRLKQGRVWGARSIYKAWKA